MENHRDGRRTAPLHVHHAQPPVQFKLLDKLKHKYLNFVLCRENECDEKGSWLGVDMRIIPMSSDLPRIGGGEGVCREATSPLDTSGSEEEGDGDDGHAGEEAVDREVVSTIGLGGGK